MYRQSQRRHQWARLHPRGPALVAVAFGLVACAAQGLPTVTSAVRSEFNSEEFAAPLTIAVPEGWIAYESREAGVGCAPASGGSIAERMVVFRTKGGTIEVEVLAGFETSGLEAGHPIAQPWPEDFGAWLAEREMFEVLEHKDDTIAGSGATIFEVRSNYEPPAAREDMTTLRIILVGTPQDGTDIVVHTGEMHWRFVLFDDRPLAMAYGALVNDFSEDRFQRFVDSLAVGEESGPAADSSIETSAVERATLSASDGL